MQRPATADLEALLRELVTADVKFVVVGGAAAVIHGAPVTTQDLDIVPQQDPEGLVRLLSLLERLDARFRPVRPDRDLKPEMMHLSGHGQLNLITTYGPLDVLLRLHDSRGYEDLISHTREISEGELRFRVLDLDTLISIKSTTGRARDALVVPLLIAIRDRQT